LNKSLAILFSAFLAAGCSPFVETLDVNDVSSEVLAQAAGVKVYTLAQVGPPNVSVIKPIEAYSCKHLMTDPPASKGDALLQLQLKAAELGASSIINVTFDTRGTDTWGTNCWETVQASGLAAK
jgi:uncharacterized protein YbjQ (UPF0145 family)|tara:strand:+ start:213 stop:584 length:372 start_codon:yes stop_codon:yes gene_type:complete